MTDPAMRSASTDTTYSVSSNALSRPVAMVLRNAAVPFGPRPGLQQITMTVARGERVALVGPSGAGKTSLLRAIAGLDPLAGGVLEVNGVDVTTTLPEQRRAVYLHQTPALFPHLSVLDNVAFSFHIRGGSRAEARERAHALLARMQLVALAHRMPARLSGGERHRTALARALAAEPALLLLDEPFSALDPALRADIRCEVLAMLTVPESPGVIVITHDVDEAAMMGERIAVLLDGTIAQDAPSDTVIRRPATVAVAEFLGVPNFIPGRCTGAELAARTPVGGAGGVDHATRATIGTWTSALGACECTCDGESGAHVAVGWADMIRAEPVTMPVTIPVHERDGDHAATPAIGVVQAVEHRGIGRVVRVHIAGMTYTALAGADTDWHVGDQARLVLNAAKPHLLPTPHV